MIEASFENAKSSEHKKLKRAPFKLDFSEAKSADPPIQFYYQTLRIRGPGDQEPKFGYLRSITYQALPRQRRAQLLLK